MIHVSGSQSRLLAVLLVIGICLAPWPAGSNRDWAWPVLSIIFGLITVTLIPKAGLPRSLSARTWLVLLLLLCGWMLLQRFFVSLNTWLTTQELLKTLTYGCLFFALLALMDSRKRVMMVLQAVLVFALLQALFGALQQLLFEAPRSHGSFPNPNHFAGYLEASLGVAIALLLASSAEDRKGGSLIRLITGHVARFRLIIVILVIALVMSRSRMGNLAFLVSLLLTAGVALLTTRKINRSLLLLTVSILVIDILIISQYFGLERLQERIREAPQQISLRAELPAYNLRMIRDRPITGAGAGTYESVFPHYRDAAIPGRADHAESDYFELLVELGIPGCALLLAMLIIGLHAQLQLLKGDPYHQGIGYGCMIGTVSLLIHGLADVNLQIPANAMMFVLLSAVPIALLEHDASTEGLPS